MAESSDTLTLTDKRLTSQGIHELEISFGGESGIHKHYNNCTKNPGHFEFFPIHYLKKNHLPVQFSSGKILALIKQLAKRTVKLSVSYVSPNRPSRFPLSCYAGQDILSVGSGCVTDIGFTDEQHSLACPFENCRELPGQHQVWGYITITTAAHIVFDDAEANSTTVEFFNDRPEDKKAVRTARGVKVGAVSQEGDFCELLCVTHDVLLYHWINHLLNGCTCYVTSCLFDCLDMDIRRSIICGLFKRFSCLEHLGVEMIDCSTVKVNVNIRMDDVSQTAKLLMILFSHDMSEIITAMKVHIFDIYPRYEGNIYIERDDSGNIELHLPDRQITLTAEAKKCNFLADSNFYSGEMKLYFPILKSLLHNIHASWSSLNSLLTYIANIQQAKICRHMFTRISSNSVSLKVLYYIENMHKYIPRISNPKGSDNSYQNDDNLVIHISHPHGQSKMVTFGTQTNCLTGDGHYHQLYTAPTCPGSSGGPVWTISNTKDMSQVYGVPHSGCHGNQVNQGCSWTIYPGIKE